MRQQFFDLSLRNSQFPRDLFGRHPTVAEASRCRSLIQDCLVALFHLPDFKNRGSKSLIDQFQLFACGKGLQSRPKYLPG